MSGFWAGPIDSVSIKSTIVVRSSSMIRPLRLEEEWPKARARERYIARCDYLDFFCQIVLEILVFSISGPYLLVVST